MNSTPLFCYFGHHKCATGWFNDILNTVASLLNVTIGAVNNPQDFGANLKTYLETHQFAILSYTNADIRYTRSMSGVPAFHVIRDPRDIIVSGYFSHLHSHKTDGWSRLVEHRKLLKTISLEEGLYREMDFAEDNINRIRSWDYHQSNILELRFQRIAQAPYQTLLQIFEHLDMLKESPGEIPDGQKPRILAELLLAVVYHNRFAAKAKGRAAGAEDSKSHYRKGTAGDWKQYFTADHIRYFRSKFGDVVEELGFDSGTEWNSPLQVFVTRTNHSTPQTKAKMQSSSSETLKPSDFFA